MAGTLDRERREQLRAWGAGLATDERDELRAAGRAIVLLADELERLDPSPPQTDEGLDEDEPEPAQVEAVSSQALATSLRERLAAVIPGRSSSDPQK
jgi:hypothetical protein